jgi:hypothetical protein
MAFRDPERVRYPWQIPLAPRASAAALSPAERRQKEAKSCFEWEGRMREEGVESPLVLDEQRGFYRFAEGPRKGKFALSEEYADWEGLKEIGYFREWGL